jgi:hypothetical protein
MKDYIGNKRYIKYSGRFGINKNDQADLIKIMKGEKNKLEVTNKEDNILVLGSEEFMYVPMMFAKEMGGNIYYHSTSRSPIIENKNQNYPINTKFKLNSFYGIKEHHFYHSFFSSFWIFCI